MYFVAFVAIRKGLTRLGSGGGNDFDIRAPGQTIPSSAVPAQVGQGNRCKSAVQVKISQGFRSRTAPTCTYSETFDGASMATEFPQRSQRCRQAFLPLYRARANISSWASIGVKAANFR